MSDSNRISQTTISSEGPRQTPNQSFGLTLSKTLAQGASGAMGLASPILGAVNPALSAPVSQGAQIIGSYAASAGGASVPNVGGAGARVPTAGATGVGGAGSAGGTTSTDGSGSGGDSWAMLQAQKSMQEEGREFNMQYLQLQESMQRESREYQTISNVMKVRHDSAKAAINNIH